EVARRHGVPVIEDACQAHGAAFGTRRLGSLGAAGAFSFYPGKNLGAWGEGGCVTTDSDELAARVRLLRDHGSPEKYRHTAIGFNYRLEGIQGAVLEVKLRHLDAWNDRRRALAERYRELLSGAKDLVLPEESGRGRHAWHIFAVRSGSRDALLERF